MTSQMTLEQFREAKAAFLDGARRATATEGFVDGTAEMEKRLVSVL
jgi:hypothetical protein